MAKIEEFSLIISPDLGCPIGSYISGGVVG